MTIEHDNTIREMKFGIIGSTISNKYTGVNYHLESCITIYTDRKNIDIDDIQTILKEIKYRLISHFVKGIDDEIMKNENECRGDGVGRSDIII